MSQNFKEIVPYEYVLYIIQSLCNHENNYFFINDTIFKQNIFNNKISSILYELKDFYFDTKLKYIENGVKYKGFITIIRQLCKLWDIKYNNKIKYNKNKYDIEYYFYI